MLLHQDRQVVGSFMISIIGSLLLMMIFAHNAAGASTTDHHHRIIQSSTSGLASIKLTSFNIQILGQTKMKKTDVVDILLRICSQYDLIFVMEVRDSTNTTIQEFTSLLNGYVKNYRYDYQLSERLGRTSSKEQYAYLYNPEKVKFIKTLQFNDTNDWFERPPFTFVFQSAIDAANSPQFAITGCHIKPTDAVAEMSKLVNVTDSYSSELFSPNIILAGDFNAGCSYVSQSAWNQVVLRSDNRFAWLISDQEDTTVSSGSCPYDRFVTFQAAAKRNVTTVGSVDSFDFANVGIFRFDDVYGLNTTYAATVSDHYPIYMTINVRTTSVATSSGSVISPKNSTTIVLSNANSLVSQFNKFVMFGFLMAVVVISLLL